MTSDSQLLAQFSRTRAEDAFAELVRRHVNLVYSSALRQIGGDAHLAQDVAQTVFTDLARKAPALASRASLTGWLFTSARFAAAKIVRAEHRRRDREEKFMREPIETGPDTDWEKLRPALDDVMHQLPETDREAILLRYFEDRPYAEIGARCGLNENAARMRVERALEKLRGLLAKRGVTTVAALASVLSANAVQVAPAGLASALASASLSGARAFSYWSILNLTKLKIAAGVFIAAASTAWLVEHQALKKAAMANEVLTQQINRLNTENKTLSNLAAQSGKSAALRDAQSDELLRLRGEIGILRQQTNDLARLRRVNQNLRDQTGIEYQDANPLSPNDQFTLRQTHAVEALNKLLDALKSFSTNHDGRYPGNLDQLVVSGDLRATNFAGNLGVDDFELLKDSWVDATGLKYVLRLRTPFPKPGTSQSVIVYGAVDGDGGGATVIENVAPNSSNRQRVLP